MSVTPATRPDAAGSTSLRSATRPSSGRCNIAANASRAVLEIGDTRGLLDGVPPRATAAPPAQSVRVRHRRSPCTRPAHRRDPREEALLRRPGSDADSRSREPSEIVDMATPHCPIANGCSHHLSMDDTRKPERLAEPPFCQGRPESRSSPRMLLGKPLLAPRCDPPSDIRRPRPARGSLYEATARGQSEKRSGRSRRIRSIALA